MIKKTKEKINKTQLQAKNIYKWNGECMMSLSCSSTLMLLHVDLSSSKWIQPWLVVQTRLYVVVVVGGGGGGGGGVG